MREHKVEQIDLEPTTTAVTAPARRAADHEFGSQGTELKLSVVGSYLRAFTRALRGKFPALWYSDAFHGPDSVARRCHKASRLGKDCDRCRAAFR
jgi:hypothetical protein